jgi:hypothetical protein
MATVALLECSFLIPIRRDANLSDGLLHEADTWDKLEVELFERFGGGTTAPGIYAGFYADPDTGKRVDDESKRLIVAVPESRLGDLRQLVAEACDWFQQKCIYLSVAGHVEFVSKP